MVIWCGIALTLPLWLFCPFKAFWQVYPRECDFFCFSYSESSISGNNANVVSSVGKYSAHKAIHSSRTPGHTTEHESLRRTFLFVEQNHYLIIDFS